MIEEIKKLLPKWKFLPDADKNPIKNAHSSGGGPPYGKKLNIDTEGKRKLTHSLTQRERDTFLLLLEGYTLKETADRLGIGYSTANTYLTAVYRKLHVNSRAELIINYLDLGKQNGEET